MNTFKLFKQNIFHKKNYQNNKLRTSDNKTDDFKARKRKHRVKKKSTTFE